jgi:hypothetical protein
VNGRDVPSRAEARLAIEARDACRKEIMSKDESTSVLRASFRQVSLCVSGIAHLYDLPPAIAVRAARALADVFRQAIPSFEPPPLGRGRAALLVLADALRDEADAVKTNPEVID